MEGLSQCSVSSTEDIDVLLTEGMHNRTVGSTLMNQQSSRSHAIFRCADPSPTCQLQFAPPGRPAPSHHCLPVALAGAASITPSIHLVQTREEFAGDVVSAHVRKSRVALIDLAGSESAKVCNKPNPHFPTPQPSASYYV